MQRIVIVGTTGSGKSHLARLLAQCLDIPQIELDSLFWQENWQHPPEDIFREQVQEAVNREYWIMDGNYSRVRDLIWTRADTLVWLDYPLIFVLWRLFRRTLARVQSRELLWGKNRETWRGAFISRDSLFLWALKTHQRHRRDYPEQFKRYPHLNVIHLHSLQETEVWIKDLNRQDAKRGI